MLFDLPLIWDVIGLAITCAFAVSSLIAGKELVAIIALVIQVLLFW